MASTVIISVVDVLGGERYRFPVYSDCAFRVKHLRHELLSMIRRKTEFRLLIIKDGLVCDDEQFLVPPYLRDTTIEYYIITQPKESVPSERVPCVLDEVSLEAAQEWVAAHGSYLSPNEMQKKQYILQTIEKLTQNTTNSTAGNEGAGIAAGDAGAAGAQNGGGNDGLDGAGDGAEVQWLNFRVLLRLFLGFLFFVQGSSSQRITIFLIASVIYYVIETGIALFLLNTLLGELPPPPAAEAAVGPPGGQPETADDGADVDGGAHAQPGGEADTADADAQQTPPRVAGEGQEEASSPRSRGARPPAQQAPPPQPPLPLQQQVARQVLEFAHSGAAIPPGRTGGVVVDVLSAVAAFALSFIPEWSPAGINRR
jgi:hypothetical protein